MICWPFHVFRSCNPAHFGCHTLREPQYLLLDLFQEIIRLRQPSSHFFNTFIIKSCQSHCTGPTFLVWMGVNPIYRDIPAGITWFFCCKFHMKNHIPICNISPTNTVSICTKSVVSLDVCTLICATRLSSAFTGHANICISNATWCTHAPLNKFFCSVICNDSATATNSSCLIVLRGRGERKPQVLLSLKNVTSSTKNCWVVGCRPCCFGEIYSPTHIR